MKAGYFTLIILLFTLCAHSQEDLEAKHPKTYKAVVNAVNNLPETISFLINAKDSKPIVYVEGPSNSWNNYWSVKVGISNFDMLRTSFHLFVNPKTLKVYYLDDYDGADGLDFKLITLQQWRKWRTMPAWKKLRKYKNGQLIATEL